MGLAKIRSGESFRVWERRDRFYKKDGVVYFKTREGIEVGPFDSRSTAARALELYKYIVNECSATGLYASQVVTKL